MLVLFIVFGSDFDSSPSSVPGKPSTMVVKNVAGLVIMDAGLSAEGVGLESVSIDRHEKLSVVAQCIGLSSNSRYSSCSARRFTALSFSFH